MLTSQRILRRRPATLEGARTRARPPSGASTAPKSSWLRRPFRAAAAKKLRCGRAGRRSKLQGSDPHHVRYSHPSASPSLLPAPRCGRTLPASVYLPLAEPAFPVHEFVGTHHVSVPSASSAIEAEGRIDQPLMHSDRIIRGASLCAQAARRTFFSANDDVISIDPPHHFASSQLMRARLESNCRRDRRQTSATLEKQ